MTIQVWAGANPSSGFSDSRSTAGRRIKGVIPSPRGANHSGRQAKTPELSSADLRPCNVLALLLFQLFIQE